MSKSIEAVPTYSTRWHQQRINRRLDDRDNVIKEAMELLENHDATVMPAISAMAMGADFTVGGGALTGCTMTVNGAGFGSSTQPSGSTADSTGQVDFVALVPGDHDITITITMDGALGGGAATITNNVAAGTIAVSVESDGSTTAATVIDEINNDSATSGHTAMLMVLSSVDTPGVMDAAESVSVTDGVGEVMTLSMGAQDLLDGTLGDCVTAVNTTTGVITFSIDPSDDTAGDIWPTYLRLDGCLCPVITLAIG